jgi:protein-disulfide isomerase
MEQKTNKVIVGILVGALFLVGVGGSFYVGKITTELKMLKGDKQAYEDTSVNEPEEDPRTLAEKIVPLNDKDNVKGNKDANIVMFEYSDFECSYCATFHGTAEKLIEEYGDEVAWVYRHFPLDSIHPNARRAAIASECVAQLGGSDKFWEFANSMFKNQATITATSIRETALSLGLNKEEYATCTESEEIANKVEADLNSGVQVGVRGTPGTVLLNKESGEAILLPGALKLDQLKAAIEQLK